MPAHLKIVATLAFVSLAWLAGCGGPSAEPEPVAELSQALNACEETVPANRFIDGLPAYAQCSSTTNSAIWSNNGIDTSTASLGTGWVRTQRSGGYQCTEWAWRYMHFKWGVDYQNGNAGSWCDGNLPATLAKATTPVHGDLIVFAPGICGSDATTGHIAVIDTVNASAASVTFVEENDAGRRSAKQTCATCFLHAVANDGSTAGAGTGGGNGLGGAASNGGSAASGGRAPNGGFSSGGALAGSGPMVAGSSSLGGLPGSAGATSGGTFATTGGTFATTGGTFATTGGMTGTAGTPGNPAGTTSGGTPATGGSSWTGGVPGNPLSTGGTSAVGVPIGPISDVNSGCSVSPGARRAGASGWLEQLALALAALALRRRVGRRKPAQTA